MLAHSKVLSGPKIQLPPDSNMLVASPDGENESIQLRQQIWITQLNITPESAQHIKLKGKNAYLNPFVEERLSKQKMAKP